MSKSKIRKWVWYSTPDSFNEGKISILAICETIVFSWFYLLTALKYGTFHLTIAVMIVPLLLLRTDESVRLALNRSENLKKEPVSMGSLPLNSSIILIIHAFCNYIGALLLGGFLCSMFILEDKPIERFYESSKLLLIFLVYLDLF